MPDGGKGCDSDTAERDRKHERPDGAPDELVGLCVKWYENHGYGFLWTDGKPDMFLHHTGLEDIAADRLKKGDEVRYVVKHCDQYGDVARVTEYLRSEVPIPEHYKPQRQPAKVLTEDKHTG
eukprot:gene19538-biopygen21776